MLKNLAVINDAYYSDETKTMIRANKEYLLKLAVEVQIIHLNYVQAFRYDFTRVLRMMDIPIQMHWIISFLNGIENPNQDIQGMTSFLNVDPEVINSMITRMNTNRI